MRTLASAFIATAFATASHAATPEDVYGLWLVESGAAIVEIAPCGDRACGKIVWLAEPNRPDGSPKIDAMNPEASLKSRPICGLPMIGDFSRDGDGWDDGYIYDASAGDTYTSTMHVTDEGNLYVRGYVGISLFGKSQTWTRVGDNRGGC